MLKRYGSVLGIELLPITTLAIRYFDKNYGKILDSIPDSSVILEIGPGGANFTQYLLYKGFKNITVCEVAEDNAQSLACFFRDKVRIVNESVIDYLGNSSDTFDFIYAAQLIEHFTYNDFIRFLMECSMSLRPGGYLVLETINCANVTYGLYLRYCDYTHRMGFTPRSLKQFLGAVGHFSSIELMEIHPPGLLDLFHCVSRRIRGNPALVSTQASGSSIHHSNVRQRGLKRLTSILLRNPGIRFSRGLSSLLLGHYEFDRIRIYTPFFAIAARKTIEGEF